MVVASTTTSVHGTTVQAVVTNPQDNNKLSNDKEEESSTALLQQQQQQQPHSNPDGTPMIQPVAYIPGSTAAARSNSFFYPPALIAAPVTHNLIPQYYNHDPTTQQQQQQQQLLAVATASLLNGTPGHPVLIPPGVPLPPLEQPPPLAPVLTVQDRPLVPPIYNGVNPNYPGVSLLHGSPPIFTVSNFLTRSECEFLISAASDSFTPAPVVGKGSGEISPSRTSSTCYLAREDVPDLMRKVSVLTGKPIHTCELPQVGRYEPTQQYLQHYDAFDVSTEDGLRFASNGGQRTVTVLIYLNDVPNGGQTRFPTLNLEIQPRRGMALVFFPATLDGLLDKAALHAALPAAMDTTKYVSQVWIRQGEYKGQPSKRLEQTMGVPL